MLGIVLETGRGWALRVMPLPAISPVWAEHLTLPGCFVEPFGIPSPAVASLRDRAQGRGRCGLGSLAGLADHPPAVMAGSRPLGPRGRAKPVTAQGIAAFGGIVPARFGSARLTSRAQR